MGVLMVPDEDSLSQSLIMGLGLRLQWPGPHFGGVIPPASATKARQPAFQMQAPLPDSAF